LIGENSKRAWFDLHGMACPVGVHAWRAEPEGLEQVRAHTLKRELQRRLARNTLQQLRPLQTPNSKLQTPMKLGVSIRPLRQNVFDHMPVHVGQSEVPSLKLVGQVFVIDPEQMHQGGLKIVDVNLVLDGVHTEII
jgi:hypothetical protein